MPAPTREWIAVDIDNVLGCSDLEIRKIIRKQTGVQVPRLAIKDFSYSKSLQIPLKVESKILREFHSNHLLSLRVLPHCRTVLKFVVRWFHVLIVTSRPQFTKCETIHWLRAKKIPYNKIVFSKTKILPRRSFAFAVEDHYESAILLAKRSKKVFLFDYPWNRNKELPTNVTRISGWKDLWRHIDLETLS